jgi:hypothetical protein
MGNQVQQQKQKKILVLYFSHSSQTKNMIQSLIDGMDEYSLSVVQHRIEPVIHQPFPLGSIPKTFVKMVLTFFRQRVPIKPLPEKCFARYDLIILAGPTWSYNPSGPILSLMDRDGKRLFDRQTVIPLISCRGYWLVHWLGLKSLLKKCGATVPNLIVFTHTSKEPWRTIGVFFKLAGETPERMGWMKGHYRKYGHTRPQRAEAHRFGEMIARALTMEEHLEQLDFKTGPAMYDRE